MRLNNLPSELKQLKQWACSTATTKVPLMPNGLPAKVNDPTTWSTFEDCEKALGNGHDLTSIGFILTSTGPYTAIDLDQDGPVEQRILGAFDSYTERSRSGRGYHIIVKGKKKPGSKSRRDKIEVYDRDRYIICTGDVINPNNITEQQTMLNALCDELGVTVDSIFDIPDAEEKIIDSTLMEMCSGAKNGKQFDLLCNGEWEAAGYSSQSEADAALVQWFAAFSENNQQVERLFMMSGLAKRAKAHRFDYFPRTLARARKWLEKDRATPPASAEPLAKTEAAPPPPSIPTMFPPGLVGEVAQYIYDSSYLQASSIALAGSLTMFAGMCGRAFNVRGDGLNLYLILLADTGRGKEGAQDGVDRLMLKISEAGTPAVMALKGPSHFASGQALHKKLVKQPTFFSFLGEFGHTLEALGGGRANSAEIQLRRMLLQVYGKSGANKNLSGMEYSDAEKNVESIRAPSLTFMGETTPDKFFEALDPDSISEGLIPRFIIIEHDEKVPPRNRKYEMPPSEDLVERLKALLLSTFAMQQNNTIFKIEMDSAAEKIFDELDEKKRGILNETAGIVEKELWNRVPQNAQRLAALIAVGVNPHAPIITAVEATWAREFINASVAHLLSHFKKGDVGKGSNVQLQALFEIVDDFIDKPFGASYLNKPKYVEFKKRGWVPREYLMTRASNRACFTKDSRQDVSRALDRTLQEAVDHGGIVEMAQSEIEKAGFGGKAWKRISK